tara:strand:+ start:228 stop:512 length:285 start_codon:yes stop_codon:yes gene_type:complete
MTDGTGNAVRAFLILAGWLSTALFSSLLFHASLQTTGPVAGILGAASGIGLLALAAQVLVWSRKGLVLPPRLIWVIVFVLMAPWLAYTVWPFPI